MGGGRTQHQIEFSFFLPPPVHPFLPSFLSVSLSLWVFFFTCFPRTVLLVEDRSGRKGGGRKKPKAWTEIEK